MPSSSLLPESLQKPAVSAAAKADVFASIERVYHWLEAHDYRAYDTFDGLNARFVRPLTFNNTFLRTALLQGVRRFPLNLRPLLGVKRDYSTKGMGFLARAFMRLNQATGDPIWNQKAEFALEWLLNHQSSGYSGSCWGNHFDYQSRTFYLPKGVPTIVWTSLIGHAFLDGWEHFRNDAFLRTAVSACEHILRDLETIPEGDTVCISYIPGKKALVHNANTLGASLLIRAYAATGNEAFRSLACKALDYTANHQRSDGSWYYGEKENLHWVDNFHTGYVLDCYKRYQQSTGDGRYTAALQRGYDYWKRTFFLSDGTPRYYDTKTLPIDIQCSSQAIDTLVLFQDQDPTAIQLACKVAEWTVSHMQDRSGYFYYRRYSRYIVNKTPTLHWGQATMLCALAALYKSI